jgi:hypothetical protein
MIEGMRKAGAPKGRSRPLTSSRQYCLSLAACSRGQRLPHLDHAGVAGLSSRCPHLALQNCRNSSASRSWRSVDAGREPRIDLLWRGFRLCRLRRKGLRGRLRAGPRRNASGRGRRTNQDIRQSGLDRRNRSAKPGSAVSAEGLLLDRHRRAQTGDERHARGNMITFRGFISRHSAQSKRELPNGSGNIIRDFCTHRLADGLIFDLLCFLGDAAQAASKSSIAARGG